MIRTRNTANRGMTSGGTSKLAFSLYPRPPHADLEDGPSACFKPDPLKSILKPLVSLFQFLYSCLWVFHHTLTDFRSAVADYSRAGARA